MVAIAVSNIADTLLWNDMRRYDRVGLWNGWLAVRVLRCATRKLERSARAETTEALPGATGGRFHAVARAIRVIFAILHHPYRLLSVA